MKQSIVKTFILVSILSILGACKEPDYTIANADDYARIFMSIANNGLVEKEFPIANEWHDIELGVGYGGVNIHQGKIDVNFMVDEAAIAEYNHQNASSYTLAPEGSYRLSESVATIQEGSTGSNSISLQVNPLLLQGTRKYLIPVSITDNSADIPTVDGLKTAFFLVSGYYESNPFDFYANTDWRIHDVSDDTDDAIGGRAKFCIDNDLETCWLSNWRRDANGWRPPHPHHVAIDMNEVNVLHGIKVYGRIGSSQAYLFPSSVFIETSMDGATWDAAGVFSIVASADENAATMYLERAVQTRYFRFTVLRSKGNGDTTAAAEIMAF